MSTIQIDLYTISEEEYLKLLEDSGIEKKDNINLPQKNNEKSAEEKNKFNKS